MDGHIYLINAIGTNRYKIGFAVNVEARVKKLQTASPFPLFLIKTVPGTPKQEARLHKMYNFCRVSGEWFEFHVLTTIWHMMDLVSLGYVCPSIETQKQSVST